MTMSHAIYRVESSRIVGPYTLRVKFDDETEQTIDFRPVLEGDLYGPLRDSDLFDQATQERHDGTGGALRASGEE